MKWLLVLLLSLSGIAVGYVTLLHVSLRMEQLIWLFVFLVNGFVISRFAEEKHFAHGFMIGLFACIAGMVVHLLFYSKYLPNHPEIILLNSKLEPGFDPRKAFVIIELTKSFFYSLSGGLFAMMINAGIKKFYENR